MRRAFVRHAGQIESQWTARRRERAGVVLLAKAHPPAKNAGRVGKLILRTNERMGQPPFSAKDPRLKLQNY
jgi:hypothetical protein